MVMTPAETAQDEAELREQDEAGFRKGAELSKATDYGPLFDALEAEDIDSIRYYSEEMAFWARLGRNTKDRVRKYLYELNVTDCKENIEECHNDIIERRELRKEFSRVSGRG